MRVNLFLFARVCLSFDTASFAYISFIFLWFSCAFSTSDLNPGIFENGLVGSGSSCFGLSMFLELKVHVAFISFLAVSFYCKKSNLLSGEPSSNFFLRFIGFPSFFLPLVNSELVVGIESKPFFAVNWLLNKLWGLPYEGVRDEIAASLSRPVDGVCDFLKNWPIPSYFWAVITC